MNRTANGLLAGLAATAVLSALMLIKTALGLLPQFNVIELLAGALGGGPPAGWMAHLFIGTVIYGVAIANLAPILPGVNAVVHGVTLGVAGWVLMMLVVMPALGAGVLAIRLGVPVTIATLVLHLIFGSVLGATYGRLSGRQALR